MGAESLGAAFKNVANQIIADLLRIAIRQAIIKPLAGALGLGFADGGEIPGFASGGMFAGPGGPRSDSLLARVSPGEFIIRSEEHTSELQSLMRISYAVFCLKKKNRTQQLDPLTPTKHTSISTQHST